MTAAKIFVTGTDTGVGKTVVSAIIVAGLEADYWKPVQSGEDDSGTDSEWIKSTLNCGDNRIHKERFRLTQPLSPHAAAKIDNVKINLDDFKLPDTRDRPLIVEGAGGVLVPLNEKHLMLDLIVKFGLPVIVVARSGLGTINHTLLTLRSLKSQGATVLGVVMNGEKNPSNREAIEHYGECQVIAEIEPLGSITGAILLQAFSGFILQPNSVLPRTR